MNGEVLRRGNRRTIRFAVLPGGKMPAKKQWDKFNDRWRARFDAPFARLTEEAAIQSKDQFKKIRGDLWQLRRGDWRMLMCQRGSHFVIATIVHKNVDELPDSEFAKAEAICADDIGGE